MSSTAPVRRPSLPRLADVALSRARLNVVPRLRSRAPRIPFVTLVSVILLGGVIGLLLFNTSMQQASFQATALQQQADTLTAREQALQARTDALDDPQAIAARADRQGMVIAPACTATVDLDAAKVTGACPAATTADRLPLPPPVIRAPATAAVQASGPVVAPTDPVRLQNRCAGTGAAPTSGAPASHHGRGCPTTPLQR